METTKYIKYITSGQSLQVIIVMPIKLHDKRDHNFFVFLVITIKAICSYGEILIRLKLNDLNI